MDAFTTWLLARLEEPSTYAGIAAFVASLSFIPNASSIAALIVPIGAALAGALAIIVPEKK